VGSGVPGGAPWRCMDIDLQRWRRLLDEIEDRRSHGGALVLPGVRRGPLAALKIASLLDRGLRRTESGQSIPASRHSSAASEGFAASFFFAVLNGPSPHCGGADFFLLALGRGGLEPGLAMLVP